MHTIGVIRKFETLNFIVIIDALPEDDLDLSWDETGEVAEKLDSGEFIAFVARARIMFKGEEIASDYLGGCIYESIEAFMDHRECGRANRQWQAEGKDGRCGSYFSDMITTVCAEARKYINDARAVHIRKVA